MREQGMSWAGMILKSLQARGEGVSWSAYESSRWRLWWGSGGRSQHVALGEAEGDVLDS